MEAAVTAQERPQAPQHMRALERANQIRLGRAQIKREILAGKVTVVDIVKTVPLEMETCTLAELLCAQRRWGRTRARKFLLPLALNENKQLAALTNRQRRLLAAELEARASG